MAWVWPYSAGTNNDSPGGIIVAKEAAPPIYTSMALLGLGTDNRFSASLRLQNGANLVAASTGVSTTPPSPPNPATYNFAHWHHVAGTWDGQELRLYVNGLQEGACGASTAPSCAAGTIGYDPAGPLMIGRHWLQQPGGGWRGYHGKIDEVHFFGRPLSPAEIRSIYDAGPAGTCLNSFRLTISQPVPGLLEIRNVLGPPGHRYFTALTPEAANAGSGFGTGWWGGLHINIPLFFAEFMNGLPPFVGVLDGAGGSLFALPNLPPGLFGGVTWYGVTHALGPTSSPYIGVSAISSLAQATLN
jgi:hypothetical protein